MNEIVLAAGSLAGVFTAMAIDKVSQINTRPKYSEHTIHNGYDKFALERKIVYEAMRRVYDYEREGRITSVEREKLLARYRQHLETLSTRMSNFHFAPDIGTFKADLISVVDQRTAQINAKLEDLMSKMSDPAVQRPPVYVERKEKMQITPKKVEQVPVADTAETSESDASLDEIKKQIMQTLSRLEQAEVE